MTVGVTGTGVPLIAPTGIGVPGIFPGEMTPYPLLKTPVSNAVPPAEIAVGLAEKPLITGAGGAGGAVGDDADGQIMLDAVSESPQGNGKAPWGVEVGSKLLTVKDWIMKK